MFAFTIPPLIDILVGIAGIILLFTVASTHAIRYEPTNTASGGIAGKAVSWTLLLLAIGYFMYPTGFDYIQANLLASAAYAGSYLIIGMLYSVFAWYRLIRVNRNNLMLRYHCFVRNLERTREAINAGNTNVNVRDTYHLSKFEEFSNDDDRFAYWRTGVGPIEDSCPQWFRSDSGFLYGFAMSRIVLWWVFLVHDVTGSLLYNVVSGFVQMMSGVFRKITKLALR